MKNPMRPSPLTIALAICLCACAAAQLSDSHTPADGTPDQRDASVAADDHIVAALKQALELATSKAVAVTGKPDGFLDNEAIRILLPTKLQSVGKAMRLIGEGDTVDELEVGMNRAAERSTPQAKQIFLDALKKMNFRDARRVLTSGDTAATEYFEKTCSADLAIAFFPSRPIPSITMKHGENPRPLFLRRLGHPSGEGAHFALRSRGNKKPIVFADHRIDMLMEHRDEVGGDLMT